MTDNDPMYSIWYLKQPVNDDYKAETNKFILIHA